MAPTTMLTCRRDVQDYMRRTRPRGKMTCAEIGELLGVSDERVRQVSNALIAKLQAQGVKLEDLLAAREAA